MSGAGPAGTPGMGRSVNLIIEEALAASSRGTLMTDGVPGLSVSDDAGTARTQNQGASWALRRVIDAKGSGPLSQAGRTRLTASRVRLEEGGHAPEGAGPAWDAAALAVMRWALSVTDSADEVTCHVACVTLPRGGAAGVPTAQARAFPTAEEAASWAEEVAGAAGPSSGASWTVEAQRFDAGRAEEA